MAQAELRSELIQAIESSPRPGIAAPTQVVHIAHAAEVQVAAGDITNYKTFIEFIEAADKAIDGLVGVDGAAKEEARGMLAKIRGAGDEVATAAVGSAGGAVLGAVLKQLLGLH